MVGKFVQEQKVVNVQSNQRINTMERTLNTILDRFQRKIAQKFDNLQYSISKLTNKQVQEKGKFPSHTQLKPKGVHEIAFANEPTPKIDEVKAVITLRSGKQVGQPMPKPLEEAKE